MKKFFALFLVVAAMTVAGCGKKESAPSTPPATPPATPEEKPAEPANP